MTALSEEVAAPLVTGPGDIAAMLEALSRWADGELAAHRPPVWVAQQMSAACIWIAWAVRNGELRADALDSLGVGS